MPALKKQRIDLRLTDDDKSIIEEAAAISNQTITQFVVASASERAAEVIEQHRRMVLWSSFFGHADQMVGLCTGGQLGGRA
ncbi:type II toxin-antitoxin system TacA family antitoxin, partial [Klebsiella pneumoniae]|uniref:type II toxin-antitoxin system TacA family antitoxin n=1 Tax=Klebsiella pneumoniae TaxID=573 RepID=UPI002159E216